MKSSTKWLCANRALFISGLISFCLLWLFHDVYWWQKDDSVFAALAEVVYRGGIFGVDVYDIHGGYHTLLNALMFKWFGVDMVVLRYPIILIGTIQAMLITYLLRTHSAVTAGAAGVASVALGFLLFPNPSPNWFVLFFAVVVVFLLTEFRRSFGQLFAIGLMLGLCFMFRHPSAVFLGTGVLAYLLHSPGSVNNTRKFVAKGLVIILSFGVLFYSYFVFEPFAFVLFGFPPLLFLFWLWRQPLVDTKTLLRSVATLILGFILAIAPMIFYELVWGDLPLWLNRSFLSGTIIAGKDFFSGMSYVNFIKEALDVAWKKDFLPSFFAFASYHILIFALPLLVAAGFHWQVVQKKLAPVHPVLYIVPFYGLVSFYYQIAFYLHISLPLFLLAFLCLIKPGSRLANRVLAGFVVMFTLAGLGFGAPGVNQLFYPDRFVASEITKASLYIPKEEYATTTRVLTIIEENTDADDMIYAFPFDPDWYFLADRKNPFPFIGSSFDVIDESTYAQLLSKLQATPPTLVVQNTQHSYKNEYDDRLGEWLASGPQYRLLIEEKGYRFYLPVETKNLNSPDSAF